MSTQRFAILTTATLAVTLLMAACTSTATTGGTTNSGDAVKLTEADNGKPVELAAGQTLLITLPSNKTTGYSWAVAQNGAPQLTQEGESVYTQDAQSSGMAGAGGSEAFTFKAAQSGSTTLTLNYARPFETDQPPANTFSVPVSVK